MVEEVRWDYAYRGCLSTSLFEGKSNDSVLAILYLDDSDCNSIMETTLVVLSRINIILGMLPRYLFEPSHQQFEYIIGVLPGWTSTKHDIHKSNLASAQVNPPSIPTYSHSQTHHVLPTTRTLLPNPSSSNPLHPCIPHPPASNHIPTQPPTTNIHLREARRPILATRLLRQQVPQTRIHSPGHPLQRPNSPPP